MKVNSIFEGTPQKYLFNNKEIITSIFKEPKEKLISENLELILNKQANLKHHGGNFKAIYSYSLEHYDYWKTILSPDLCVPGVFGENLTTEDLDEAKIFIGDQIKIGSMILEVSQPRIPCSMLNFKLNRNDAVKLFVESQKTGIYWKIIVDGEIKKGDKIHRLDQLDSVPKIKLSELVPLLNNRTVSKDLLSRVLDFPEMDPKIVNKALEIKDKRISMKKVNKYRN